MLSASYPHRQALPACLRQLLPEMCRLCHPLGSILGCLIARQHSQQLSVAASRFQQQVKLWAYAAAHVWRYRAAAAHSCTNTSAATAVDRVS